MKPSVTCCRTTARQRSAPGRLSNAQSGYPRSDGHCAPTAIGVLRADQHYWGPQAARLRLAESDHIVLLRTRTEMVIDRASARVTCTSSDSQATSSVAVSGQ